MERKEDKYFIVERCRKQIPNLRAVTFIGEEMIVVSNQEVFQCNFCIFIGLLDSLIGNFELLAKKSIMFES